MKTALFCCCNNLNLRCNTFDACNPTCLHATIFLHFSRRVIIKIIICFWLNSVGYFTLDLQMGSDDSSVMSQLVFDWLSWNHLKGFSCSVFKIFEFFGLLGSSKYSKSSRSSEDLEDLLISVRSVNLLGFNSREKWTKFFCSKLILI